MTAIPRVCIGMQPDGSIGLRSTLPGYNVLTDDPNDSSKFSFNSDWPDLLRNHQIGMASINVGLWGPQSVIPFTPLGYIPHVEARLVLPGPSICDDRPHLYQSWFDSPYVDYWKYNWSHSLQLSVTDGALSGFAREAGTLLYVIFKERS